MPKIKTATERKESDMSSALRWRLEDAREAARLSYDKLAEKAELTTVGTWRAMQHPEHTNTYTLIKLCIALGV